MLAGTDRNACQIGSNNNTECHSLFCRLVQLIRAILTIVSNTQKGFRYDDINSYMESGILEVDDDRPAIFRRFLIMADTLTMVVVVSMFGIMIVLRIQGYLPYFGV